MVTAAIAIHQNPLIKRNINLSLSIMGCIGFNLSLTFEAFFDACHLSRLCNEYCASVQIFMSITVSIRISV